MISYALIQLLRLIHLSYRPPRQLCFRADICCWELLHSCTERTAIIELYEFVLATSSTGFGRNMYRNKTRVARSFHTILQSYPWAIFLLYEIWSRLSSVPILCGHLCFGLGCFPYCTTALWCKCAQAVPVITIENITSCRNAGPKSSHHLLFSTKNLILFFSDEFAALL